MKIRVAYPFAHKFRISSPFGERIDPKSGKKKMHNGIDFSVPVGTPIRAVLDGSVMISGWENRDNHEQGYGQRIWQECSIGKYKLLVVYAHLSEIHKHDGEWCPETSIIGLTGNTGKSTGPHLHLGARIKDTNEFVDLEFEDDQETPYHDFKEVKYKPDSYIKGDKNEQTI